MDNVYSRFRIPLTVRQAEYVALSANGMTTEQIAQALFVTTNTVSSALTDARRKVDAKNTTELSCLCLEAGFIYWDDKYSRFRAFNNS